MHHDAAYFLCTPGLCRGKRLRIRFCVITFNAFFGQSGWFVVAIFRRCCVGAGGLLRPDLNAMPTVRSALVTEAV